ncbi:hypothetical protein D3C71_1668530 [compost metagenome]
MNDLIERSIACGRRRQGDGRDLAEPTVELILGDCILLLYLGHMSAEHLQVQPHGIAHDHVRIGHPGDGIQHTLVVLFLQVDRQSIDRRIRLALGAHPVPAHLHAQPLLGPVAGKPGNEVGFGTTEYLLTPALHGFAGVIPNLFLGGQ